MTPAVLSFLYSIFLAFSAAGGVFEKIDFDFGKLIVDKVKGSGYTVESKSLTQCLQLCRLKSEVCDGAFYFESVKKCRLVKKCGHVQYIDVKAEGVFYSRRQMVKDFYYVHNPITDGCIRIITQRFNYEDAEKMCKKENGRLLKIDSNMVNGIAKNLLIDGGLAWAWIHADNVTRENLSLDKSGMPGIPDRNVRFNSTKNFTPGFIRQRRNPLSKNCYAINNRGQWGEFSCSNQALFALCEIPNN